MASKKKASEGIALLSMYNDEDDEIDEPDEQGAGDGELRPGSIRDDDSSINNAMDSSAQETSSPPPPANDDSTPKSGRASLRSTPLQQQFQPPHSSPMPPLAAELRNNRKGIVDYAHDEAALSPEPEDGEFVGSDGDGEHQTANGYGILQEKTHQEIVQNQDITPSNQAAPQSSEQLHPSQSDVNPVNDAKLDPMENDEASVVVTEEVDILGKFLPPPPKKKCSDELQEKINKFLVYKRSGKSFNAEVRNRKDYRNPDFLLHAVRYQDIDQIGACFSKDVFDPHGYDKSDYYDEIEADMKRELERKEQEKKKSQKVDFVSGGTQPGILAPAPKISLPLPGVSTGAASGLLPVPAGADVSSRDSRHKKSKWDKVDGDRMNSIAVPSSGGKDSSSVGAHAALLSAANAGAGYTAFAQQRRREAEEKRSSERKLERRS